MRYRSELKGLKSGNRGKRERKKKEKIDIKLGEYKARRWQKILKRLERVKQRAKIRQKSRWQPVRHALNEGAVHGARCHVSVSRVHLHIVLQQGNLLPSFVSLSLSLFSLSLHPPRYIYKRAARISILDVC